MKKDLRKVISAKSYAKIAPQTFILRSLNKSERLKINQKWKKEPRETFLQIRRQNPETFGKSENGRRHPSTKRKKRKRPQASVKNDKSENSRSHPSKHEKVQTAAGIRQKGLSVVVPPRAPFLGYCHKHIK